MGLGATLEQARLESAQIRNQADQADHCSPDPPAQQRFGAAVESCDVEENVESRLTHSQTARSNRKTVQDHPYRHHHANAWRKARGAHDSPFFALWNPTGPPKWRQILLGP